MLLLLTALGHHCHISSQAFVSGQDGYHTYRIPAVVKLPESGDLMMFAEGRKLSSSDHGWNDVVAKTSGDNGASWGPMQIVYSESSPGNNVCIGNPAPIALQGTAAGQVVLVACRDNKEVILLTGKTTPGDGNSTVWSKPSEISKQAVKKDWTWVATGPPQGIQLMSGRLVIGADHISAGGEWGSHAMYSDNAGKSWALSNEMPGGNECQAAALPNGTLVMNQRTRDSVRQFSWSQDHGETWSDPTTAPFPQKYAGGGTCSSTISAGANGELLLFSTPFAASSRSNMTVFVSTNGGMSWDYLEQVDPGPSAYSALVDINATHYGLAYESRNYGAITFVALPLPPAKQ